MFVVPEALPLLRVRVSKPKLLFPCVAVRDARPVGCGEVGDTETATLTGVPCVMLTAFPAFKVSVLVDETAFARFQLLNKLFAFTELNAVAKSEPAVAWKPVRMALVAPAVAYATL